jgi:hypothetical protein
MCHRTHAGASDLDHGTWPTLGRRRLDRLSWNQQRSLSQWLLVVGWLSVAGHVLPLSFDRPASMGAIAPGLTISRSKDFAPAGIHVGLRTVLRYASGAFESNVWPRMVSLPKSAAGGAAPCSRRCVTRAAPRACRQRIRPRARPRASRRVAGAEKASSQEFFRSMTPR